MATERYLYKKFFCFELEVAALLMGYLGSILCVLSIVAAITELIISDLQPKAQIIAFSIIFFQLIQLTFFGILIHGTKTRDHTYLLIWWIFSKTMNIIIAIVIFIAIYIIFDHNSDDINTAVKNDQMIIRVGNRIVVLSFMMFIILYVLVLVIYLSNVYVSVAIYSFYREIKNEHNCANKNVNAPQV